MDNSDGMFCTERECEASLPGMTCFVGRVSIFMFMKDGVALIFLSSSADEEVLAGWGTLWSALTALMTA